MMHLKRFDESEKTRIEDYLYSFYDTEPLHIDQVGDDVFFFVYITEQMPGREDILSETKRYFESRRFSNYHAYWDLEGTRFAVLLVSKEFKKNHPNLYLPNIKWETHPLNDRNVGYNLFPDAKISKLPNNCSLVYGLNRFVPDEWELWPMDELDDPIRIHNETDLQFYIYKYCA
jgi:hypothetical protein